MSFFSWMRRSPPPTYEPDLREIIMTTMHARAHMVGPGAYLIARNCFVRIVDDIVSRAPALPTKDVLIDWLVIEVTREEFSLAEDSLDASAA